MLVMRSQSCGSNLDLNSDFYRLGVSQFRKGSLNLKFQRLLINFHHLRLSSHFPVKVILWIVFAKYYYRFRTFQVGYWLIWLFLFVFGCNLFLIKIRRSSARRYGFCLPPRLFQVRAMDDVILRYLFFLLLLFVLCIAAFFI